MCKGEMPKGRVMFPASARKPQKWGGQVPSLRLDQHVIGRCQQKRRVRQYWAPTIDEQQINPTFIFNSAWEAQSSVIRQHASNDSLSKELK
jgi:hypothetical protein